MRKLPAILLLCLIAAGLTGCAIHPVETPLTEANRQTQDRVVLKEIRRFGADGDWLVVRQYHSTDNLVSTVRNAPLSHAAVLDLSTDSVLEATAKGVHRTSLTEFVARSHRVQLLRPQWSTPANRQAALARGTSSIGKGYDFTGLAGWNHPDRLYCSELAVEIYTPWRTGGPPIPRPVAPDQLYHYARILYDSGPVGGLP
jgi:hypothetical protein